MSDESKKTTTIDYFIKPGYIFVSAKPAIISAVLGSCVSVCIYDNKLKIGGMNNFKLPKTSQSTEATARFGNVSTSALIRMMIENGSRISSLEAQIFGGSNHPDFSSRNDVGEENIMIAKNILKKKGIDLVSQDVGGQKGRKIVYDTRINQIAVLKVDKLRKEDWYPYENFSN
jgi:chemotaxis protein CheD